jgi:hypothetical protein
MYHLLNVYVYNYIFTFTFIVTFIIKTIVRFINLIYIDEIDGDNVDVDVEFFHPGDEEEDQRITLPVKQGMFRLQCSC